MAMAFTFRVLENGARNFILQVNGADAVTTTAATSDGTSNGILNANSITPTVHNKVRRITYNTLNCTARLQWHATTNVDLAYFTGYGEFDMIWPGNLGNMGIWDDGGTGVTGDIDLASFATNTVTGGAGLLTAAMTLLIYGVKGT